MRTRQKEKKRGDGEGSVFTVRGRWRAQLPYRTDAGVRRFLTKSFDTKGEADQWITGKRHGRFQGHSITPETRTVAMLLDEWLDLKKNIAPKTMRSYSDDIKNHLKPGLGEVRLAKLTTPMVQRLLNSKIEKFSPKTIKTLRDTLRAALNSAVEWDYIRSNPAKLARPPKARERSLRVLSIDEARTFLAELKRRRPKANRGEGTLFRLMLSLAVRKGEAIGLWLEDLDLDADPPVVHIRRALQAVGGTLVLGAPKGGASARRTLPLSAPLAAELRQQLVYRAALKKKAGRSWLEMNYVFTTAHGTPIYPRNVNRSLKAILKRAGIPHLRVHDLRHSAATFAIADGVPAPYVQRMLGHSDVRTTLSVYTKIVPSVLQQATGTLDRVTEPTQKSVVTDKVTDEKKKRTKVKAVTR